MNFRQAVMIAGAITGSLFLIGVAGQLLAASNPTPVRHAPQPAKAAPAPTPEPVAADDDPPFDGGVDTAKRETGEVEDEIAAYVIESLGEAINEYVTIVTHDGVGREYFVVECLQDFVVVRDRRGFCTQFDYHEIKSVAMN